VDNSAGGLLVPEGIILSVVCVSALTLLLVPDDITLSVVNVYITGWIPLLVDY
jgi:hypothetical protein